jgi:hypothetical protein
MLSKSAVVLDYFCNVPSMISIEDWRVEPSSSCWALACADQRSLQLKSYLPLLLPLS